MVAHTTAAHAWLDLAVKCAGLMQFVLRKLGVDKWEGRDPSRFIALTALIELQRRKSLHRSYDQRLKVAARKLPRIGAAGEV